MTRVIRGPELHHSPVDVPAPPAWDATALAAYEFGYRQGNIEGRLDVTGLEAQLGEATDRCLAAIDAASEKMTVRVLEVAELFVTTALRHLPEARTAGLLVRLGEALRAFDADPLEVSVAPSDVADVVDAISARSSDASRISVIGEPSLRPGEFLIHSAWADAVGTFDRYFAAARDAMERAVAGERG
jgi:flagellar biosynthesis/type III secretory pathway protein FliH